MGCWGTDSFHNDDAADWLFQLNDHAGLEPIRRAFTVALAEHEYLEAPEASQALAAAEALAALLGRPTPSALAQDELMEWIERHAPSVEADLPALAIQTIERILDPDSELLELWADTDELGDWQQQLQTLRQHLLG